MEELIPLVAIVMTFSVPLAIILIKSQVGKALARYLESKARHLEETSVDKLVRTENLFFELEKRVQALEGETRQLKQSNEEMRRLLGSGASD